MEKLRRKDPTFVNWDPKTAIEAVDKFQRLERMGIPAMKIPEALIECAKKLEGAEIDTFTEWCINPMGIDGCDYHETFHDAQKEDTKKLYDEQQSKEEPDEKQNASTNVETPPVGLEPPITKCAQQNNST